MARIHFRGARQQARAIARRLALTLTGREPDAAGLAAGVFRALGFAALSDIKDDFVRKARGGTGEDGVTWEPLKRATIAYNRRFGKGEQAALKKAAGLGPGHRHGIGGNRGLLSASQKRQWQAIFASSLARFAASMPEPAAKSRAAAVAWAVMKKRGAKTMLEVFGGRHVEILRDTGVLLNSLSPGQMSGGLFGAYSRPSGDGGAEQVFDLLQNGVIVGTTVKYAAAHQYGYPPKGIPARPFLPESVPDVWAQRWLDAGLEAVELAARHLYGAASQ